jgi:hypothetical protein
LLEFAFVVGSLGTPLRGSGSDGGLEAENASNPAYLAKALEIGGTLRLSDEINPGMTEGSGGRFCVVMPLRAAAGHRAEPSPAASHAAA